MSKRTRIILAGIIGGVLICCVLGSIAVIASGGGTTTTRAAPTATTRQATPTPAGTPDLGTWPHIGGPLATFEAVYPIGNGTAFCFDSSCAELIGVESNSQGIVTGVNVIGPTSWDTSQTSSACRLYLPRGAVETSSTARSITYSSPIGELVITVQSPGTCILAHA